MLHSQGVAHCGGREKVSRKNIWFGRGSRTVHQLWIFARVSSMSGACRMIRGKSVGRRVVGAFSYFDAVGKLHGRHQVQPVDERLTVQVQVQTANRWIVTCTPVHRFVDDGRVFLADGRRRASCRAQARQLQET